MAQVSKARVFMNGRSQHVTIPAKYRFSTDEVYINRDPQTGVISLSEKPLRPSMAEIFAEFDAAGGAHFAVDRDLSLPVDRDIL
jgi:virulence-associated protein VagC